MKVNKNIKLRIKATFFGFLLGLLFPLAAGRFIYLNASADLPLLIQFSSNKLFLIICSIPFILSIASYILISFNIKRLKKLERQRDQQFSIIEKASEFIYKISDGDFYAFPERTKDEEEDLLLSAALLKMRSSLIQHQEEETKRNWIITGKSEVGDILRKHKELKALGGELISYLANKIDVVQVSFYVINEIESKNNDIEMIARYPDNQDASIISKFKFGQGIIGKAIMEQNNIYRSLLPDDEINIAPDLLINKKPRFILIVPLIANEKSYGALELFSIGDITPLNINFIKEISGRIAQTIFNLLVNQQTLRHLKEVSNAQKRQNTLLENASEIITIYDQDGTIKYISPSSEKILGFSQSELIGKKDIEHIHEKGRNAYKELFEKLLCEPKKTRQIQFSFNKKDGQRVWMEAIGRNMLDNHIINGIVLNTRDITMKRLAEKEERRRGQMQALSENSPDLILRVDESGLIYYVNPTIQKFTNSSAILYIAKTIDEVDIEEAFATQLKEIVSKAFNTKVLQVAEFIYKKADQKYILDIKAIPEFNELEKVETVLIVANDITRIKAIQNAMEISNKKITESINYAQRIQHSLLPVETNLQEYFPNSLLFFKPKDVVSGDFPYLYVKGDNIYIAVVDCTGHGVPGALMSFIGYFTLNQILSEIKTYSAAEVLDELHNRVQRTLKQDTGESKSRDGMDIAICKINKNSSTIEFSGAHRPLYVIKKDTFNEIKADRYPIAGMHYKTRLPFTNNLVNVEKGDTVFFYTDGLPDQFGGPDGKKLTSSRVRELLQKAATMDMASAHLDITNEFDKWKGAHKQMDDVLLIGITF